MRSDGELTVHEGPARTVVNTTYACSRCGASSSFDGLGGEWCPECQTADYLVKSEQLYRLVEISLD